MGVEYYAGISDEKEEYFYSKLTNLFMKKQVMRLFNNNNITNKKREKSKPTLRKLLSSKFSLQISCFHAEELSRKMIEEFEIDFLIMKKIIKSEVDFQEKIFLEKLKKRQRQSYKLFMKNKNKETKENEEKTSILSKNLTKYNFEQMIDEFFNAFFLKFYFKINLKFIEFSNTLSKDIYKRKIINYKKYESEIQKLDILKSTDSGIKFIN